MSRGLRSASDARIADVFTTITFLSDFGLSGGYVAACEAVLGRIAPGTRVLHVGHQVPPGDIGAGGRVLARVAPLGPTAVHLAVVDPGVGTDRRAVALHAGRGDFLVGPDNGLLIPAAAVLGGVHAAWSLDPQRVADQADLGEEWRLSNTFHGRDLFAPAAGLLARDLPGGLLGEPVDPELLEPGRYPRLEHTDDNYVVEVTEIDRFGNVSLSVGFSELRAALGTDTSHVRIRPAGGLGRAKTARLVVTFADLSRDEVGMVEDSWGTAAIVMNNRSAAEELPVERGELVTVAPLSREERGSHYEPEPEGR